MIKNNKGPNMLHSGIPLITLDQDQCSSFRTAHCFLLHKKSVIHVTKSVFILYIFSLNSSMECGTVSYASAKSVYITSICLPESNCSVQSSIYIIKIGRSVCGQLCDWSARSAGLACAQRRPICSCPVSYTHLTLPTILRV